jgi:hypothetical protein
MAVGTVSSVNDEVWQLISSQTASTSAAITFSSLSGYKKYMVIWKNVASPSAVLRLKVNNDNTAGNYASSTQYVGDGNAQISQAHINLDGLADTIHSGLIVIEDADKSMPHRISSYASYLSSAATHAILNIDPITRIDLYLSTGNLTSGTVALYGIAA